MGHKVIGLVSGGKDSCFNLLHAVANGHEIVALATLTPAPGIDELDSHLYQSVGTQVPPLIAQALGVPHYTRVIKGKAVHTGSEYGARRELSGVVGDETEDLTELLRDVLTAHPDSTALASGAILSTYQRQRIEHVCSRLGLTSIAYLWQARQLPLVDRMIACGLEVVLVKVAGVGLAEKHVGRRLGELRGLLARLEAEYGAHPAGEGGEYETLTLDTPLFSHRIILENTEVVVTDPEPYTVAYLRIGSARLVAKEDWLRPGVEELREMLGLNEEGADVGLGEEGKEVLDSVGEWQGREGEVVQVNREKEAPGEVQFGQRGGWFAASVDGDESSSNADVASELSTCFDQIEGTLQTHGLALTQIAHITLLLSSMSLFPIANRAYQERFGTSPPSRATVAVPLGQGANVRLEVIGYCNQEGESREATEADGRSALHVQGLSYWAPANIGPYSQAVRVNERIHLAGQIPLIPSSLTLPSPPPVPTSPYPLQSALALQHVSRIVELLSSPHSTGGGWEAWGEACTGWWSSEGGKGGEAVDVVRKAWEVWAKLNRFGKAPVVFVQAKELPRGALVEYQANLHTGRPVLAERNGQGEESQPGAGREEGQDEDGSDDPPRPVYVSGSDGGVKWESYENAQGRAYRAVAFVSPDVDKLQWTGLGRAVTVRAYYDSSVPCAKIIASLQPFRGCYTLIPVVSVHDRDGYRYPLALEVFGL